MLAFKVKVSLPSWYTSSVVAIRTCRLVCPAGMVSAPVTGCQTAPSKYSNVLAVSLPTVAVPLVGLSVNTVLLADGLDKLTVKTSVLPSAPVGLEMFKLGIPSSSTMVAIPAAVALLVVLGLVLLTLRVKVSSTSSMKSLLIGVRTKMLVLPTGIVAVVALAHVVPLSNETCKLLGVALP